jgi:hypothetical protein
MKTSRYSVQTAGQLAESFQGLEAWRANTLTTQEGVTGLRQMIGTRVAGTIEVSNPVSRAKGRYDPK